MFASAIRSKAKAAGLQRAFSQTSTRMAAAAFVQQGKKVTHPSALTCEHATHSVLVQIVAIGRNYSEHAKELKNAIPKEPIIFLKPTTSYLPSGGNMEIPQGVLAHYEGCFHSPPCHSCTE